MVSAGPTGEWAEGAAGWVTRRGCGSAAGAGGGGGIAPTVASPEPCPTVSVPLLPRLPV